MGFVEASQRGDRAQAAEYLQWPRQKMTIGKEEAADQLRFILNHGYEGNLDRLSRDPGGSTNDGFPADRERVGAAVLANGERVDIFLARVSQTSGPAIWLIAADIVSEIPRMYDHAGLPELERRLPKALTTASFGQLQLWVPLALLALLPVLYVVSRLLLWIVLSITRLVFKLRHRSAPSHLPRAWKALSGPSAFLLTLGLHRLLAPYVGIPLLHRQYYSRTVTILLLAGVVLLLWRLVDLVAERMRDRLQPDNPRTAQSVYVLGRRLLKGTALAIALLAGLAAFGVDLTTTLAGLGIGGIALAFAAQKTLENVFGGIMVLSDRSIVVGDVCQIGKYVGEVVDVGLRSMQLRTINRTVVYVPNGTLATMEVENMSRRDKFLFNPTVGLRYGTTLEQLQRVTSGIKDSLTTDLRVEHPTLRVRLVRFGASSLDVEVFAYVKTPDYPTFLGVQEELLVRIMGIVQYAGTGLALPSQTMYVRSESPAPGAFPGKMED
jgi:MscS family membrane protein